jgi:hypothetical protein
VQFTISLPTLIAIGSALALALAALAWAFRQYSYWRRMPGVIKTVQGDPESDDPEIRDGVVGRLSDVETTTEEHVRLWRGFFRALRIHPSSDEHAFAAAIRESIIDGRITETTGPHPAIVITPRLPPPVIRRPTPHRGDPIPREDPDSEHPVKRR